MDPLGSGSLPGQNPLPSQTPGVWPPPPTNAPFGQGEHINTSGMKGEVPPEIARLKWNWGAFFLPFLWSVNHKIKWGWGILAVTLLSRAGSTIGGLFALVYFAIAVYLGLKGHTLGWQNRRFAGGTAQYFGVQSKWLTWGLIVSVLSAILAVGGMIGNHLPGGGLSR